jgi:signal transduction histidine kinase
LLEATLADCVEKYRSTAAERLLNTQLSCANKELRTLNTTLDKARKEALAGTRAKSEFLANMSHELRTPMNSIIGFTELMIDDEQDPPTGKRSRRLEKVHRNARNLLALVNDILDLSKIEAQRLTLECVSVDVAALVHECVESTQPLLQGDKVKLTEHIQCQLPLWEGDPVRLRQIVTNLLSNAAKFTEDGCIAVRVGTQDGCMRIEVEDSGIGISAEDLPKVFGKFEQVDSSSARRAGGTGLGLAICRNLCELMGCQITVKSVLGVGSCFTVTVPLKRTSARPQGAERAATNATDPNTNGSESPKVGAKL